MFWLILITVTAVVTFVILGAFGWRVFVAARGLVRQLSATMKIVDQATETLNGIAEMDGVKAMRTRTQRD
jgi:hypothetical protein